MKSPEHNHSLPSPCVALRIAAVALALTGCSNSGDTHAQSQPAASVSLPTIATAPKLSPEVPAQSVDAAGRNLLLALLQQARPYCQNHPSSPKGILFSRSSGSVFAYKWDKTATPSNLAVAIHSKQPKQGNRAHGYDSFMVIIEGSVPSTRTRPDDTGVFGCDYLGRLIDATPHVTSASNLPLSGQGVESTIGALDDLGKLVISQ